MICLVPLKALLWQQRGKGAGGEGEILGGGMGRLWQLVGELADSVSNSVFLKYAFLHCRAYRRPDYSSGSGTDKIPSITYILEIQKVLPAGKTGCGHWLF